jgi:hypothetical protein
MPVGGETFLAGFEGEDAAVGRGEEIHERRIVRRMLGR